MSQAMALVTNRRRKENAVPHNHHLKNEKQEEKSMKIKASSASDVRSL
jgi:hypothetical protein